MNIEFFKHNIEQEDINEVIKTLKSRFITTGEKTTNFEKQFAEYTSNTHCIGLTSCTAGLFLALKAFNFTENSEVITTPLSFAATANTIIHAGCKPVFCDVNKKTGNIDINAIENNITSKTKAIVVVHLYGQMCDMKKVKSIAQKYNLKIIEDAAHCVEGQRDNVKPGNLSDAAAFSFYATKNITSGEGGALTTNNRKLADKIKTLRLHGLSRDAHKRYSSKSFQQYEIEDAGYKFNMFDIQAALLINQLKRINENLKKREQIWNKYNDAFLNKIQKPEIIYNSVHAKHLYTIWVDTKKRDKIIEKLFSDGISVSVHFKPIHLFKYYKNNYNFKKGMFPNAEEIGASTITLPLYPSLKETETDYIIKRVLKHCT